MEVKDYSCDQSAFPQIVLCLYLRVFRALMNLLFVPDIQHRQHARDTFTT